MGAGQCGAAGAGVGLLELARAGARGLAPGCLLTGDGLQQLPLADTGLFGCGRCQTGRVDESWLLDELAYAGPEHLDESFIAGFDRKQGYPDPDEDIAAFAAHGLGRASVVADLGAGTGQFAVAAARWFGRVIAADVSPAMLAALRAKADREGLGNVTVERSGFLGFSPGSPLDGVFTRNALHQLPDFWKAVALQRIADMLRPGGVLRLRDLAYDFAPGDAAEIFAGWFAAAATDPAAGYTAADYAEHIRTEHSTFRWLLEPMLAAAGFEISEVSYERRLYGAYTCVKAG
jgi:SAM-dependent methyltransferase